MKIGIIGSGLAGLAAGRELVKAGHEVTVIEKTGMPGGRLTSAKGGEGGDILFDYGTSWFTAETPEFRNFVAELLDQGLIKVWDRGEFWHYDGEQLLKMNPNSTRQVKYIAPGGMGSIARYLSRWLDIRTEEKAGGLTYLGANRGRKRAWMVNLTTFNTMEADAIVVAAPAPQAYGVLLTTQDETPVLKLIREIDEVYYNHSYALMATYGSADQPEWHGISCNDSTLSFISNENSKREMSETSLVVWSSPEFAREQLRKGPARDLKQIEEQMLERLGTVLGSWASKPRWSRLHEWRFASPGRVIDRPYMEFESEDAPLALVGDYFMGGDVDHSYASGIRLARHWIETFSEREQPAVL